MGEKYYCSKCEHFHYYGKVYEKHKKYKSEPPEGDGNGSSEKNSDEKGGQIMSTTMKSSQREGTGLRNINLSGGLFTENIVLRLRNNPDKLEIGEIESFIEDDSEIEPKTFKNQRREIFEWSVDKWDAISPKIDDWSEDEIIQKWLKPLFTQLGYELEPFEFEEESIDPDSPIAGFKIKFQSQGHENPFFHFVGINDDFESKIKSNPNHNSHHKICQQFINRIPEIKWLFLSNGRMLRILTEYYHTYSKGYIEFDLENIFANRDSKEFNTMYAIVHKSRYIPKPDDHISLIDEFKKESNDEGVKVGDNLRDNVHEALELLGNELIQQNHKFLDIVLDDGIDLINYYAELLRIIYRIIFILYAEQREMLPGAGSIYFEEFSLSALRMVAEQPIRVEKSYDLWNKLLITFGLVGEGSELLEVNSYNGDLFDDDNLSIILDNDLQVTNSTLLRIIRLLTTTETDNVRQRINFLEIKEEEIGAIYESLLDYKPYINESSQFQLIHQTTERKSTGSYYTPKELIDILIRTTLQPLVEDRLSEAEKSEEQSKGEAILDIKVCDPACGGGTFLLSALDFLGKKLAEVRTGRNSPSESNLRESRREILQHCIYGVDMNPLAVELCKISLWLRASVKNKPLNFLDNHITCGNSLIGLGQKQKIKKIDPYAFEAIDGQKSTGIPPENTKIKNQARRTIRKEIKERENEGKPTMITKFLTQKKTADICSAKFQEIINMPEDNPKKVKIKEEMYNEIKKNEKYQQALDEANIWTSTFFWPFEGRELGLYPKHATITQLREGIERPELKKLMKKVEDIAEKNQFFHWYIEFPEVFSSERGGFDCILTNPPWDVFEFKEMEFFTGSKNEILNAPNQSERRKLIKDLKKTDFELFKKYKENWRNMKKASHFLNKSSLFDLSSHGKLNTYALFVERCWRLISKKGYTGIVCPTGVIMNYYMQDLFQTLVEERALLSIFDFINNKGLFDIHRDYRFCLMSLGGENISKDIIPMTFYTLDPKEIQESLSIIFENKSNLKDKVKELPDNHNLIPLEQDDFELFNPNTITCPTFRNKKDAELLRDLYKQAPILINRNPNTGNINHNYWNIDLTTMFNISSDSDLFYTYSDLETAKKIKKKDNNQRRIWIDNEGNKYLPVYEGRMIWHYNHRLNSMKFAEKGKKRKALSVKTTVSQFKNKNFTITPNYWIRDDKIISKIPNDYDKNWFLCFRKITGSTNERTFISSIIPKTASVDSLILTLSSKDPKKICCLLANMNSIIFDFAVRQKLSTNNLNFYIVEQFPVFPPSKYSGKLRKLIISKVLELTYTSYDLKAFAEDLNYFDEPFNWDSKRRAKLKADLDAIFAHLYDINKNDLKYILNTFNVLKKKEKQKFNEFRKKQLVLKAYDKFSKQKELFE